MKCSKCGAELPENETRCPNCGEEVDNITVRGVAVAPHGFSSKRNIIIIVIAALVVLGGIGAAIAFGVSYSASQGAGGFQLAEKYLSEQNYEQAIIAFEQFLEIEPMNVDVYLGLADAYIGVGNKDKALEIIRNGLELTRDVRIQAKIDELIKPAVSSSNVSSLSKPVSSSKFVESEPISAGSVTILGGTYDIKTTTSLDLSRKNLTNKQLKEIAPQIQKLINLKFLDLYSNQISDITPLAGLSELEYLYIYDNQISDITPLAGLTHLRGLLLGGNQIKDISPLTELTELHDLTLYDNQISDITPLAGLTKLRALSIWGNQISDITPLMGLTDLTRLVLQSNQISDADKDRLKAQLPNCNIQS